MFKSIGNLLGKVPIKSLTSNPNFPSQFHLSRGYAAKVKAYVGDNRNILDYHRRLLAEKYELRRKLYKAMWRDTELPGTERQKARNKLSKLPRNSSFTRLRNRCIFTGRSRGVYQKFRISRIVFREMANKNELTGVQKASW